MVKPGLAWVGALLILAGCDAAPPGNGALQAALREQANPAHEWRHYYGDRAHSHYSPLDQVNRDNVVQLQVAWRYQSGTTRGDRNGHLQCNPLVVRAILYCVSPGLDAFALNAATGELLWRFDTPDHADRHGFNPLRGVAYWEEAGERRILFAAGSRLYALDALSGRLAAGFGDGGSVDLHTGLPEWAKDELVIATTPGTVFEDLLIVGSRVAEFRGAAPGHVRAFDVRTGALRWVFHTIPRPGEPGAETWPAEALATAGGANAWAGVAVDVERGIAFVPTGSASFDFYGGDRHGDNLFANSLVALDARTGERLWHYQFIRHDVWDRDLPAPPNLVTVTRAGQAIPAVAQATKTGHVFVFHRETGELLFPVAEVPVQGQPVRGERVAASQPLPLAPPPFTAQEFRPSTRTPDVARHVAAEVARLRPHAPFRPPDGKGIIVYPGIDGGAEWGGMAYDPPTNRLYVNANEVPYKLTLAELAPGEGEGVELAYLMLCAGCHGADLRGDGVGIPSLADLPDRMSPWQAYRMITDGNGRMPAFGHIAWYERLAALWYVYAYEGPADHAVAPVVTATGNGPGNFINAGYQRLVDQEGLPASAPPWGTLTAIDLDRGAIAWRIPFGDYPQVLAQGESGLGAENYGGPIVTAGGLLFIAATPDRRLRAYDKFSGELLWSAELPAAGFATPATYTVDGRQFIVVAAGGRKLGTPAGSEFIAFALPQ